MFADDLRKLVVKLVVQIWSLSLLCLLTYNHGASVRDIYAHTATWRGHTQREGERERGGVREEDRVLHFAQGPLAGRWEEQQPQPKTLGLVVRVPQGSGLASLK